MAQEYYNLEKTAEVLGLNPADVHQLRERNELRGYRDGANWKFKAADVENKLAELIRSRRSSAKEADEDTEDVLLSELELGESSASSGSVIGSPEKGAPDDAESDLRLVQSGAGGESPDMDVTVAADAYEVDQDATVTDEDVKPASPSGVLDEIDLTLDEDATLEDSQIAVDKLGKDKGSSGSGFDLSEALEDDNLVIGGSSGSGSDITIGGDSGISLVDPADSGLSLEEPVNLLDAGEESLELGEDDMLVFGEEAGSESPTELKTDDDFLLTPLSDADEDDSESGSQVIALDTESGGDEAATLVAGGGMAPMLDEDFSPDAGPQFAVTPAAGPLPGGAPQAMPRPGMEPGPVTSLPEAPYSVWNVLSLAGCTVFLALTGMMVYDLLRNMWSWNGTYAVNSSLMDMLTGFLK
jgi:hypothetical protein